MYRALKSNSMTLQMSKRHKEVLRKHITFLQDNLDVTSSRLYASLLQNGVLCEEMIEAIKIKETTGDKVFELITRLSSCGPDAFEKFVEACDVPGQAHIATTLRGADNELLRAIPYEKTKAVEVFLNKVLEQNICLIPRLQIDEMVKEFVFKTDFEKEREKNREFQDAIQRLSEELVRNKQLQDDSKKHKEQELAKHKEELQKKDKEIADLKKDLKAQDKEKKLQNIIEMAKTELSELVGTETGKSEQEGNDGELCSKTVLLLQIQFVGGKIKNIQDEKAIAKRKIEELGRIVEDCKNMLRHASTADIASRELKENLRRFLEHNKREKEEQTRHTEQLEAKLKWALGMESQLRQQLKHLEVNKIIISHEKKQLEDTVQLLKVMIDENCSRAEELASQQIEATSNCDSNPVELPSIQNVSSKNQADIKTLRADIDRVFKPK